MIDRYSFPDHRIRLDYLIRAIVALKPKRVVDLGCGRTPIQDIMKFDLYLGIDSMAVGEGRLTGCDGEYSGRWIMRANYEEPMDGFGIDADLVIWSEGPEHTLKHDKVFNNIRRLLKTEGFLMITCPNERPAVFGEGLEHKCAFDLPALRGLVEENGFTVLEVAEVYSRIRKELLGYNWLYCLATNAVHDPRYPGAW